MAKPVKVMLRAGKKDPRSGQTTHLACFKVKGDLPANKFAADLRKQASEEGTDLEQPDFVGHVSCGKNTKETGPLRTGELSAAIAVVLSG